MTGIEHKQVKNPEDLSSVEAELDLSWDELSSDWQSQAYKKTDIKQLIKHTKRRVYLAKCCLAGDLLATLGVIISFIWGIIAGDWEKATIYYLGFGSVTSIVFCIYVIQFRLQAWRQVRDAPDKAIANAVVNCQSSIKYAQLVKFSCLPFLPVANWYLYEVTTAAEKPILPALLFVNVFIATIWWVSEYFLRKRRVELERLKGFVSE
ncbi:hypothetical protein [Thalassotalea piscium]|nr:hypothetical protein [Thalassotalea piscium]